MHDTAKNQVADLVPPQAFHAGDVGIFKVQYIVLIAGRMRQLEVKIAPLIVDTDMMTGNMPLAFLLVGTTLDLLRHLTLAVMQAGRSPQ